MILSNQTMLTENRWMEHILLNLEFSYRDIFNDKLFNFAYMQVTIKGKPFL
jgi:hypothetical protein